MGAKGRGAVVLVMALLSVANSSPRAYQLNVGNPPPWFNSGRDIPLTTGGVNQYHLRKLFHRRVTHRKSVIGASTIQFICVSTRS